MVHFRGKNKEMSARLDAQLATDLRKRWPEETAVFKTDDELTSAFSAFYYSDMAGNNDALFPDFIKTYTPGEVNE